MQLGPVGAQRTGDLLQRAERVADMHQRAPGAERRTAGEVVGHQRDVRAGVEGEAGTKS